jgi:hypothetical protein
MQTGYPVMVVVVVVEVIIADVTVPAATNPARLRRIVLKVILKSAAFIEVWTEIMK